MMICLNLMDTQQTNSVLSYPKEQGNSCSGMMAVMMDQGLDDDQVLRSRKKSPRKRGVIVPEIDVSFAGVWAFLKDLELPYEYPNSSLR